MSAPDPIEQHLTLSAYLTQIQKAIRAAVPDSCWVVAELSDFKRRPNGHCYMDILESREGAEVAKARCTMFANVAGKVLGEWQQATGGLPQAGMNVLLKVRADFSPQFGFSLMVTAIDPSYTLGDMQAKMQKIIASLKERHWFDLQRGLPSPGGFWRVAVVAPHEAAGLADFRRDAEQLAAAEVCGFEYFSATFQGRDASDSIRSALRTVHEQHQQQPFDAVCIIRGGGAKSDLAWLN
ncbi:exodeoxyribonuclease VII large subunit, partial [Pseudomonas mohnii]|nr:exodeoxyribonuclease VII large subunit [Pseudomonas mohnii]